MKPRKMLPKTIPAQDPNRGYRFYRDVFDFPQAGSQSERHLNLDHQDIHFINANEAESYPVEIELIVRDHLDALKHHLANNFITILEETPLPRQRVQLTIHDSEANVVRIIANADQ